MNGSRLMVSALIGFSVLLVAVADEQAGGNVIRITRETDLDAVGLARGSIAKIAEIREELSERHEIEAEITVVPRARTGMDHDVRYASRITAFDHRGRRDGPELQYVNWHTPPVRTAHYRRGVQHGIEQHYAGRNLQAEIPWEDGSIHGVRRTFHPGGAVQTETPYERGSIEGESRTYDPEGNVIRIVNFKDGRRHGESIDYWVDNPEQPQRIISYVDGQVHGVARAYYLDGSLHWERPFVDNELHGAERHYAPSGEIRRVVYWLANERVSEAEWEAAGSP